MNAKPADSPQGRGKQHCACIWNVSNSSEACKKSKSMSTTTLNQTVIDVLAPSIFILVAEVLVRKTCKVYRVIQSVRSLKNILISMGCHEQLHVVEWRAYKCLDLVSAVINCTMPHPSSVEKGCPASLPTILVRSMTETFVQMFDAQRLLRRAAIFTFVAEDLEANHDETFLLSEYSREINLKEFTVLQAFLLARFEMCTRAYRAENIS